MSSPRREPAFPADPVGAILDRAGYRSDEGVIRAAARVFLTTGTLEMRAFARRLRIGRATLYRRSGNRDEFLADVLLWLGLRNLRPAEADVTTATGPPRLLDGPVVHISPL